MPVHHRRVLLTYTVYGVQPHEFPTLYDFLSSGRATQSVTVRF